MNDETLARIADGAYAKGLTSGDPTTRAYALGVEDLAHLLSGGTQVSGRLVAILIDAGLRSMIPAEVAR